MAKNSTSPSLFLVFLHVFATVVTGGFWLIILAIWFMLKYMKNN